MNHTLQLSCPSCQSDLQIPLHVPQFWCMQCGTGYHVIINGGIVYLDKLKTAVDQPPRRSPPSLPLFPEGNINYWWVTANPKKWHWSKVFNNPEGTEFIDQRHILRNFDEARPGDLIFGYLATPARMIVALAFVREGLQTRNNRKGILIERIGDLLENPVPWKTIKQQIPDSEPIRGNAQGTLFRLRENEARILAGLIREAGNTIRLPESVAAGPDLFAPVEQGE